MSPVLVSALTAVLIVFLLWFALGTQRNIRRGNELLTWLQGGLSLLGRRTTLRWLGSSAVQLEIVEPSAPFRRAGLTIVLEPRDLSWLWAWARARGRRDFIILRGSLTRVPPFELEAGGGGWTGGDRLERIDWSAWQRTEWAGGQVVVAHTAAAATEAVEAVWDRLAAASGGVWRLSVRRDEPHLEVHIQPPEVTGPRHLRGHPGPRGARAWAAEPEPMVRAFWDLASAVAKKP